MTATNLLVAPIEPGDWQEVIAKRLASLRQMETPGGSEYFEASEMGVALADAGFVLTRDTLRPQR